MGIKYRIKQAVKKVAKKVARHFQPAKSLHGGKAPHKVAEVVDHYEKYSEDYLATYGAVLQAGRPHNIEDLLEHELRSAEFADGQYCLDAGCGFCGPAIYFARHKNITIEAVTVSPKGLGIATEAVKNAGLSDRIKVQLGDFHKLDRMFPPNTFDRIYFLESLCYAESYQKVLASAYKVLKPGGCVYFKDYTERDFRDDPEKNKRAKEFLHKVYTEYAFTMVLRSEMISIVEKIGYKIEMFDLIPFVAEKEDLSIQLSFEQRVGFHWRDGLDFWLPELVEMRARKPV